MRIIVQRVSRAAVRVEGKVVGEIGLGLLLLVGIETGDGPSQVEAAARKLEGLRIFEDVSGHMNLDPSQVGGEFLVVSQFTLLGNLRKGRRPSFVAAAAPEVAAPLVDRLTRRLRSAGFAVAEGRFGATMEVELVNQGPVTLVLEVDGDGRVV